MKKYLPYLTVFFFLAVGYLFYRTISSVDWRQVELSLQQFSWIIVTSSLLLVALDYWILTTYDYLGYRYFKLRGMSYRQIVVSAFTCYAFNLNLGAMVGGLGFRFRIYTGWGLEKVQVPKIVLFSTVTNWLGHGLLLATIFCFQSAEIKSLLGLPEWISLALGGLQYLVIISYLYMCFKQKTLSYKEHQFDFPKLTLAFTQILLSTLQWTLVSSIIYVLLKYLGHDVQLGQIIFTSLVASVAGVLTHVPGGLGVLETIFLKVDLGVPTSDMLAALICYRVVYYLIPLLIAVLSYVSIEFRQKKLRLA